MQGIMEHSAPPHSPLTRVLSIVEREFAVSLQQKEQELATIDDRILQVLHCTFPGFSVPCHLEIQSRKHTEQSTCYLQVRKYLDLVRRGTVKKYYRETQPQQTLNRSCTCTLNPESCTCTLNPESCTRTDLQSGGCTGPCICTPRPEVALHPAVKKELLGKAPRKGFEGAAVFQKERSGPLAENEEVENCDRVVPRYVPPRFVDMLQYSVM